MVNEKLMAGDTLKLMIMISSSSEMIRRPNIPYYGIFSIRNFSAISGCWRTAGTNRHIDFQKAPNIYFKLLSVCSVSKTSKLESIRLFFSVSQNPEDAILNLTMTSIIYFRFVNVIAVLEISVIWNS